MPVRLAAWPPVAASDLQGFSSTHCCRCVHPPHFLRAGDGFALLTGWLAGRKGYSFPLFAFLGFFLGPVAALIAAVMPSKELAPAET
jgi:hypothetical protein